MKANYRKQKLRTMGESDMSYNAMHLFARLRKQQAWSMGYNITDGHWATIRKDGKLYCGHGPLMRDAIRDALKKAGELK